MIYVFDAADPELTLLPMASRRALDAAGIKLSLADYQTLAVSERRELVRLGAAAIVDRAAVTALVAAASGPPPVTQPEQREPSDLPPALAAALAPERILEPAVWQRLTGLDRYVLDKLARAGKQARLEQAFDEISSSGLGHRQE